MKETDPGAKGMREKLSKVIRRNIVCSTIALASAFFGLTGMSILMWIANDQTDVPTQQAMRLWAFLFVAPDNFVGIFALHAMTNGWLPPRIRHLIGSGRTGTTTATAVVSTEHDNYSGKGQHNNHISHPEKRAAIILEKNAEQN